MKIYCLIKNINDASFSHIIIKKFRQVMFVNESLNEIQIYTAFLGGAIDEAGKPIQLGESFTLNVEFGFNDETIKIQSIKTDNLISDFFDEIDKIKKIWGEHCKELKTQSEIEKALKECLSDERINSEEIEITSHKYLLAQKTSNDSPIVACSGDISEINGKLGYQITTGNKRVLHKGVDVLIWARTTLNLSGKLSPKESVEIEYEFPGEGKSSLDVEYLSIYMCPPDGYHILDNSTVNFLLDDKSENDDINNNLVKVVHNPEIYYREWAENHNIENRKVYRLNKEKIFKSKQNELKCEKLVISFTIAPDTEKGSLQFVAGAVFSAAITYGIDAGRLSEIKKCFWPIIPADIQWVMTCMISFYSFVKWCSRKSKVKSEIADKIAKVFYYLGIGVVICWVMGAFVFLRLDLNIIKNIYKNISWFIIPGIGTLGSGLLIVFLFISHYITPNNYLKKPISKDMFF